jgi:hypothetical protein
MADFISIANEAAEIHAFMCEDPRFGYSWSPRWGEDGEYITFTSSSGRTYTLKTGSYDCSSSWQTAWRLALEYTEYAGAINDMTYTGNAESVCCGSGLFDSWSTYDTEAWRGDGYLDPANHIAMCQDGGQGNSPYDGWDCMSEFCINEFGDVYGGQTGDQTGFESMISPFRAFSSITLHYNGAADGSGSYVEPAPVITDGPIPDVPFRVKTENGWLAEGVCGDGTKLKAFAVNFHGNGWYQACTAKHGWLEPVRGYDINDDENGYAGWEDSDIIAIRAYYETPNIAETGYFSAKYRVSDCGKDWWPWQYDDDTWDGQDGYAGDMVPIDRFYIELSR